MEKSLNFYKLLLQKEPLYCNDDRWIAFDCGNQLALYNKKYDEKLIKQMKNNFMEDLENSEELERVKFESRKTIVKVKESISRLFSPML